MAAAKTKKARYNVWQNSGYMITLAWKNQKSVLWYGMAVAISAALVNFLGIVITPSVLGAIESSAPIGKLIATIITFTAALMIVRAVYRYAGENVMFGRIELRSVLAAEIHEKFMTTSYPNTEDQNVQRKFDKASMAVKENGAATEEIWYILTRLLENVIGFVIYLCLLASLDPVLIAATLVTAVSGFFAGKHINAWGYRHRDEESEYSRRMNYINEKASDHVIAKDIRIFNMRRWLEDMYSSAFKLYRSFIARGEKVYIWGNVIDVLLAFLRNGIAYIYLINMVLNDGLSAAEFLLYFSAIGGFTEWVSGILREVTSLHINSLDISAVREFIEYPEPFLFDEGEKLPTNPGGEYEIQLRDVSLKYTGADDYTLKNINLTISPGEKLAVVGLNGAGKTTLVKLICGLYDPTEGEVLLNGINIKKYNRRDYYKHFSAVFQDFSLLAATIAGNIAQADEGVDMDKVCACADKAGLIGKIISLPDGFETYVGKEVYEEGVELSGGETQQLMLARALYKNAPIIILDEPTAALDPIAESDIYNKYSELTEGRTSVYISHRLASTRFCDRIILVGDNAVLEQGTHDELVKKGGKYAELFEIQSRYYKEGGIENVG